MKKFIILNFCVLFLFIGCFHGKGRPVNTSIFGPLIKECISVFYLDETVKSDPFGGKNFRSDIVRLAGVKFLNKHEIVRDQIYKLIDDFSIYPDQKFIGGYVETLDGKKPVSGSRPYVYYWFYELKDKKPIKHLLNAEVIRRGIGEFDPSTAGTLYPKEFSEFMKDGSVKKANQAEQK